jgi:hypothetical protein
MILLFTGILAISFNDTYAQGRDRSKFRISGDTSLVWSDTSKVPDTTLIRQPVDSSARIKYFKYVRQDKSYTELESYTPSLILEGSTKVETRLTFDTLNNVTIGQYINDEAVKVPVTITFEKYIEIRTRAKSREDFYKIVAEFYKIEVEDELEKLFKNITDITIPLPFKTETIFGPPTINLRINGLIDITGSFQKTTVDQQTITTQDQSQNNINFKQEVQVTTKGTIGDKLTIDADWNSQRVFEYENQLKIKYQGYADEVIQRIEAGNVSLETKSNLIGSTQALFGVKGVFKLGPLTLTGIASQKKSEKKTIDITGGSREVNGEISIVDYTENHYFVDTNYISKYWEYYSRGTLSGSDPLLISDGLEDFEVWMQTDITNQNKRRAVGWVQLPSMPSGGYDTTIRNFEYEIPGRKVVGYFVKLVRDEDYKVNFQAGIVTININIPNTIGANSIGVVYKEKNTNKQYGTYSNVTSPDSMVIKIIRMNDLQAPIGNDTTYSTSWKLMLKNRYSLTVKNLKNDETKLEFDVIYKPPSGEPVRSYNNISFLTYTKLDIRNDKTKIDTAGQAPDGKFDFYPGFTVDLENGEIIFPTLQPFYETLIKAGLPDSLYTLDSAVYFNSKQNARSLQPKYYLKYKAVGEATNRYQLGFNLVEGSVKVFNGSVELIRGVDYTVDYTTGELVITNPAALSAGSNIKISYETNDLFQLASKTLLGTRAELQINKTSYIGFTLINLKQQTLSDKVRIGEEPTNNTILGFDASTDIKLPFLTNLLNKIPGYNTKEESILTLRGEVALILPEANTKKSKIPSDNNESIAYIDDFEGSKKIISLGLNPLSWALSSIPDSNTVTISGNLKNDSTIAQRRFKIEWFNLLNSVPINDVYPNKQIGNSQSKTLTPLVIKFKPDQPGPYTYVTQDSFRLREPISQRRWGGFFKFLNSTTANLVDENIGYIEIWMQISNYTPSSDTAKMMIDLGIISEKILANSLIPNAPQRNFHTEDTYADGILAEGEDNGIDGMKNADEISLYPWLGSDPAGDNYSWTQGSEDYSGFNGTEGNAVLQEAKKIDTENLRNTSTLNTTNQYYEYVVPLLADSTANKFIKGGGNLGWYQYKIPLNDFSKKIGSSNTILNNVQYVRVWFTGFNSNDSALIKIVDFNLVGNQWEKTTKSDTSFNVTVVNIEDNSAYYMQPVPGDVLRQRDQTSSDPNVLLNEQSLSIEVNNLLQGQGKFVKKLFTAKSLDLLNYRMIKMFVNGDPTFVYNNPNDYDASIIIRIGSDSLNYYEYRAPIHPDIRPATPWNTLNEVVINLSDLSVLKQLRDSATKIFYQPVANGPPGSKYGIIGNPSLTSVTQIMLGIENARGPGYIQPITGSVWFDELRVLKTNDKSGYAYTISTALKLADFSNINFSYTKVDPNFHNLEGRFGTRILSNSWDISGTVNFDKILNSLLAKYVSVKFKNFFTIPVTFSHTEIYDKPKYLPGTDIELESAVQSAYNQVLNQTGDEHLAEQMSEQIRINSQTLRITNRIGVNGFKFNYPSDNFIIREIINKFQLNFTYNSTRERTPVTETKYTWDATGDISLSTGNDLINILHLNIGKFLPIGEEYKDAKFYFFAPFIPLAPLFSSNFSLGSSFVRTRSNEQLRNQQLPNPTSRNFNANRNFNLDWKFIENWIIDITGNYAFTATSDLTYLETTSDSFKIQRSTGEIMKDIFFSNRLINFGKDQAYRQTVNINPRFNIPIVKNFFDITASYSGTYDWRPPQFTNNQNLGSIVSNRADFQTSIFVKLNQFFDLFKTKQNFIGSGSNKLIQDDKQSLGELLKILRTFIPDQLNLTFSQTKTNTNYAVDGRAGFTNFWINFGSKPEYGPSRLYQLGWANDPGRRVPNVQFNDQLGTVNLLNLSTFITPIFPNNLKISFTYKTAWSNSTTLNYITNQFGDLGLPTSSQTNRIISRPTFLVGGNIVQKLAKPITTDATQKANEISESFENEFVSFPFPNWNLTLTGVEKFELFSPFASSVSIDNAYTSDYKKNYAYNGSQPEYITSHQLTTGFNPLIGVNITFKQIEGGNLTTSFKLNKTDNYDLAPSDARINTTSTSELSFNASYSKQGFSIPLFGLSLKNDLTVSFTYSRSVNDPRTLIYTGGIWETNSQTGTITTTLNPSIQYALSKSVTVQIFYKYSKTEPTEGVLKISTTKSSEAGLNIKLAIQ